MTDLSDYELGRACGRQDYRSGGDYTPQPGSPDWRTGYADGWTHAADEATAALGHAAACRLAWGEGIADHQQPYSTAEPKGPAESASTGLGNTVELLLADGRRIQAPAVLAGRVRGVDADGDLLVPLGEPDSPLRHEDGSEHLIPLTACCRASGKGAASSTGVVCRRCHREVHPKYGDRGELHTTVVNTHSSTSSSTGTAPPPP